MLRDTGHNHHMHWPPQLTLFDIAVLVISGLFIARGIWVGCIRQLASILALIIGFIAAGRLHEDFYHTILPVVSNANIAFILSYLVLFIAVYLAIIILGFGLKKVVDIALLHWFDSVMGGLIGAAKAIFIVSLIFMLLANVLSGSNNFLRRSYCYPYLKTTSEYILQLIKDADLRSSFKPKEPAIQEKPPVQENKQPPAETQQPVKKQAVHYL
jgi:membrane protein required for colicin V production